MSCRKFILSAAVIAGAAFWSIPPSLAYGQCDNWWECPALTSPDMGPGMMGQGMGSGMMGQGMGPGMMGQGMEPGMMGQGMGPGMMGQGMGHGMMGQGMGPGMMGQGMEPGMMGQGMEPGMMGQRMWLGMMCRNMGMMGNWCAPQVNLNLATNDVKSYLERGIAMMGNPHIKVGNVTEKDADTITADIVTTDKEGLVQRFMVDRRTGSYSTAQ